ncbi:MAG: hypothetical protein H6554_03430 [Chitinophagales bacterium]|nr:hypothetical protein [Chitinophagales bacterium]
MKPWKKFSQKAVVLSCKGKIPWGKSFLLLLFLWTSKQNEEVQSIRFAPKVAEPDTYT